MAVPEAHPGAGHPAGAAGAGGAFAGAGAPYVGHRADVRHRGQHPAAERQRRHHHLRRRGQRGLSAGDAAVPHRLHPLPAGPAGRLDQRHEQDDRPDPAEPVRHRLGRADRPGPGQQRRKTALAARVHQRFYLQRGVRGAGVCGGGGGHPAVRPAAGAGVPDRLPGGRPVQHPGGGGHHGPGGLAGVLQCGGGHQHPAQHRHQPALLLLGRHQPAAFDGGDGGHDPHRPQRRPGRTGPPRRPRGPAGAGPAGRCPPAHHPGQRPAAGFRPPRGDLSGSNATQAVNCMNEYPARKPNGRDRWRSPAHPDRRNQPCAY